MSADATDSVTGINAANVTDWFTANGVPITGQLRFELIAGGHSNLTFKVSDDGGHEWVLRRPPLFQVLATAHDMGREFKIIEALHPTDVPVPAPIGFCDDESINERPFYVMEYVDGTVLRSAAVAEQIPIEQRSAISRHLIDVLARIHQVDVDAVGLGDLGKKQDYIARQLRRWMRQFDDSKTRERPEMYEIHDHLAARIPEQTATGIVHGDYRLDNCLVADDGGIAAVLDWELCTLGDVMADLSQLLTYWSRPGDATTALEESPTAVEGFPEREQIIEWYQQSSGREMANIDFYLSFSSWRLASILEGVYSRYVGGAMGDKQPDGGAEAFVGRIDALIATAAAHAENV